MDRGDLDRSEQKEEEYWQRLKNEGKYPCDICGTKDYADEDGMCPCCAEQAEERSNNES